MSALAPKAPFGRRVPQGFPRSRRIDARHLPWWRDVLAWIARYGRKWLGDDRGVAAVEFGLITAALAPVFIYGGTLLGPALDHWATALTAAVQHGEQVLSKLEACK